MSPPAKKSTTKSTSGKAASGKSASGKSTSGKSAAKKDATKAAPKKKRSAKKKKGGTLKALLVAFAAGLIVAAAAAWFLRDVRLEVHFPQTAQEQKQSSSVAGAPAKDKAAAARSKNDAAGKSTGSKSTNGKSAQSAPSSDSKKAQSAKNASQSAKSASSGKNGQEATAPISPPAQSKADSPAQGASSASDAVSGAVASALIDLQSLPYEESLHATLDESIRQVDYALMQAAWIRRLPASSMRLASVEDRLEGVEPYQFQVIDLLPGKNPREFAAVLKECLAAWAEGALLVESGNNVWSITIKGVHTHSVRLYPGKRAFAPLPGAPGAAPKSQAAPLAKQDLPLASPRVRSTNEAPKLVIVIDDLGANHQALTQLLGLDFPITAAFWPHGAHTKDGARLAHAKGREIIIHQPMEPLGYPKVQPGPNVLLSGMDEAKIRKILAQSIAAVPHAIGLNNHMGSRFTQSREGVDAVIRLLKERGLFMLDSVTHSRTVFAAEGRRLGIENYRRNVFLDVVHTKAGVLEALKRAERIALLSGQAVAIGHPLPETIAGLKEWQRTRDKRVRIVKLRDLLQE